MGRIISVRCGCRWAGFRPAGPGQLRLGRQPHRPCLRGIAWHWEKAAVALWR